MNVIEALKLADEWTKGYTFNERSVGWRVVVAVLAEEVHNLQSLLEALTDVEQIDK